MSSCGELPGNERMLDRAEELVEEKPDSALSILRGIDGRTLRRNETKARYGLLFSQAMNKTGIEFKSDSLIGPAFDYYSRRGSPREQALASFYLGKFYQNIDSVRLAVEYMLKARDLTSQFDDKAVEALVISNLGYIYYTQRSFDEAIEAFERTRQLNRESGNLKNYRNATSSLAKLYLLAGQPDKSMELDRVAYDVGVQMRDTAFILLSASNIISAEYDNTKNAPEALGRLFRNYERFNRGEVPVSDYPMLGFIYADEGRYDSAAYYMRGALDKGREYFKSRISSLYYALADIEMRAGNYKSATEYMRECNTLMEKSFREAKINMLQDLEEKYHNEQLRHANYTLGLKIRYRTFMLLAVVAVFGLVAAYAVARRRRYAEKLRREVHEMNAYVERVTEEHGQLQSSYDKLFADYSQMGRNEERLKTAMESRLSSHKELLRIANMYGSSPKQFHAKVNEYLKREAQRDDAFYDLLELVNAKYNGILDYIRREHPALDDDDLCLFGLICYGLSPAEICMLYNYTNIDTIYNKRSVLRRKLGLDSSVKIERYISSLAECVGNAGASEESSDSGTDKAEI